MATPVKVYVLVKWKKDDDGTYSVIDMDWIVGNKDFYVDGTLIERKFYEGKTIVVEWPAKSKSLNARTKNSKDVEMCEATVVEINTSTTILNKLMEKLIKEEKARGEPQPGEKRLIHRKNKGDLDEDSDASKVGEKKQKKNDPKSDSNRMQLESIMKRKKEELLKAAAVHAEPSQGSNASRVETQAMQRLEHENMTLKNENEMLKKLVVEEMPNMMSLMRRTIESCNTSIFRSDHNSSALIPLPRCSSPHHDAAAHSSALAPQEYSQCSRSHDSSVPAPQALSQCSISQDFTVLAPPSKSDRPDKDKEKIVACSETGVLCTRGQWAAAKVAKSATAQARCLLMGIFNEDELRNSSLKGGKSKLNANAPAKAALDSTKLEVIYKEVNKRFPTEKRSAVGFAINCKLSELRSRKVEKITVTKDPSQIQQGKESNESSE